MINSPGGIRKLSTERVDNACPSVRSHVFVCRMSNNEKNGGENEPRRHAGAWKRPLSFSDAARRTLADRPTPAPAPVPGPARSPPSTCVLVSTSTRTGSERVRSVRPRGAMRRRKDALGRGAAGADRTLEAEGERRKEGACGARMDFRAAA